jgi:hypothetical protein
MPKLQLTFPDYLKDDTECSKYGKNGFAVFALTLYLGIDEIDEFYSNSWTEDDDDKKIDVFCIDLNEARAAIVQVGGLGTLVQSELIIDTTRPSDDKVGGVHTKAGV